MEFRRTAPLILAICKGGRSCVKPSCTGDTSATQSVGPALALGLVAMLAVAFLASAFQANLTRSTQQSAAKAEAHRAAYVLISREYLMLQSTVSEPEDREGSELSDLQPQVLRAIDHATDLNADHAVDLARFRAIEGTLQAVERQVVTQLAGAHHRQAMQLVEHVEPLHPRHDVQ